MPIFDTFQAKEQEASTLVLPVASNQIIASGTLVAKSASDPRSYAVSASDKPELNVVGVCLGVLDNHDGGDSMEAGDGKIKIHVRRGIFRFRNSEAQPVMGAGIVGTIGAAITFGVIGKMTEAAKEARKLKLALEDALTPLGTNTDFASLDAMKAKLEELSRAIKESRANEPGIVDSLGNKYNSWLDKATDWLWGRKPREHDYEKQRWADDQAADPTRQGLSQQIIDKQAELVRLEKEAMEHGEASVRLERQALKLKEAIGDIERKIGTGEITRQQAKEARENAEARDKLEASKATIHEADVKSETEAAQEAVLIRRPEMRGDESKPGEVQRVVVEEPFQAPENMKGVPEVALAENAHNKAQAHLQSLEENGVVSGEEHDKAQTAAMQAEEAFRNAAIDREMMSPEERLKHDQGLRDRQRAMSRIENRNARHAQAERDNDPDAGFDDRFRDDGLDKQHARGGAHGEAGAPLGRQAAGNFRARQEAAVDHGLG
jgi:hypothetical protein